MDSLVSPHFAENELENELEIEHEGSQDTPIFSSINPHYSSISHMMMENSNFTPNSMHFTCSQDRIKST